MPVVQTRVGPIAYDDHGSGAVVVLLHATLHDRHDFGTIAPKLASRHRVIAIDWPAHGESPDLAPSLAPGAALFADVLQDLVEALDLPPAVFVGNSVGGFCAARLAITHPHRVAGLVLVNGSGFLSSAVTRTYCRVLGTPAVMRPLLPRLARSYMRAASANDRAILDRVLARADTDEGVKTVTAVWRSFAAPEHNLLARADRITAPTLIVWGSKDTAIPLRYGRATHRAIPGSRLELLPTGHLPFSSDPAGFLTIVDPFLAAVLSTRSPK
ncbi:alpha/beta fold hydrolase [Mycobacteroides stephanolepidis]|nr:alpha/beta hydrolase [[Mycobacterium] stephanolepidis]